MKGVRLLLVSHRVILPVLGLAGLVASNLALGAPSEMPNPKLTPAYREFVATCIGAFQRSQGEELGPMARDICSCTAEEARHEKLPQNVLKKETAAMAKDPKHRIANKALLEAFQYCAIEVIRHARDAQEKPGT